jgi:hypothetical protein
MLQQQPSSKPHILSQGHHSHDHCTLDLDIAVVLQLLPSTRRHGEIQNNSQPIANSSGNHHATADSHCNVHSRRHLRLRIATASNRAFPACGMFPSRIREALITREKKLEHFPQIRRAEVKP